LVSRRYTVSSPSLHERVPGFAGTRANRGQGLKKVVLRIEPALDVGKRPGMIGRECDVGNDPRDRFTFARDNEFLGGVVNLTQDLGETPPCFRDGKSCWHLCTK